MTVFTNLSGKGVTERLQLSPVVQTGKRNFPAPVHKKPHQEPEINKLRVLLKGVSCYSDDSVTRSGQGMEAPIRQRKSTLTGHAANQHSMLGGYKETRALSKHTYANEKAKTTRSKEEQYGVQNFVLKSRSFPAVNPFKMKQIDEQSESQHSAPEETGRMARDAVEQEHRVSEQEKNVRAVRLKGREKPQSLAVACSILEGHGISFNLKREKAITKHSRTSDHHVSDRYSTQGRLSCMQPVSTTQATHRQQLTQPSTCEFISYKSCQGAQKDEHRIEREWALRKVAKIHSKSEQCGSTDDDACRGELTARSECPIQRSEDVLQNGTSGTKRTHAKLVGICNVHGTTSEGGFLCLKATQPNQTGERDEKELRKLKSKHEHQSNFTDAPRGCNNSTQTGHKEIDSLLPHKSHKEQNDSLLVVDDQNLNLMRPSTEAPNLSPVLEKRETIQLPKVETYEISPRSILDSKACSVFSKGKRRNLVRRNSHSGEWPHKRKAGILRPSVFNSRVKEQQRLTIRQPSPVSGVKITVKDPEDILVNSALRAVEKCNIPCIPEEIPPQVKKFVIRLPPVC